MDQKEKLTYYAGLVQQGLETWLPEQTGELERIFAAARYSALAPGKRLRPALLMEFYTLCGGQAEDALPFACGLEMIHAYSLIHDDLPCMDDDDLRRGKPTSHKVFGEATALLAGDALLTRAFEIMLGQDCPRIQPARAMKAASIIAFCAGMEGMIGGQMMDLAFEQNKPQASELEQMVRLKTGRLLLAACSAGCALAGEEGEVMQQARHYADRLSLAFQIQDDILDCEGDQAVLGKPIGSDQAKGKTTFVSFYGLEQCHQMVRQLTDQAIQAVAPLPGSDFLQQLAQSLMSREK